MCRVRSTISLTPSADGSIALRWAKETGGRHQRADTQAEQLGEGEGGGVVRERHSAPTPGQRQPHLRQRSTGVGWHDWFGIRDTGIQGKATAAISLQQEPIASKLRVPGT